MAKHILIGVVLRVDEFLGVATDRDEGVVFVLQRHGVMVGDPRGSGLAALTQENSTVSSSTFSTASTSVNNFKVSRCERPHTDRYCFAANASCSRSVQTVRTIISVYDVGKAGIGVVQAYC